MSKSKQAPASSVTVIEDALAKFDEVVLKGDKHASSLAVFVDAGLLSKLTGPNWQPLYGLPGSGKTIHLKALYERLIDDYERSSILPVYVNLRDCISDVSPKADERNRALDYFHTFLNCLPEALRDACNQLDHSSVFNQLIAEVFPHSGEARKTIRRIGKLVREFQVVREYTEIVFSESQAVERERVSAANAGATAASRGVSGEGRLGFRRRTKVATAVEFQAQGLGRPAIAFAEIREAFEQLADARGVKRITLLIDDWTAIDPTAQTSVRMFTRLSA